MSVNNLWPDSLGSHQHEMTPKEFLTLQMDFLSKMTKGKLQGTLTSVVANSNMDYQTKEDFVDELFIHSVKVVSPSLRYTFTLLRLAHPTLKLYPFAVYSNLTDKKYIGYSIDELEGFLKDIFNCKEVIDAINSLISQSDEPDTLPF